MAWLRDVACFFAGAFLANAVPHLVYGACGDPFPTPFAEPPGKGLSSPMVNVLWALLNLLVAYILFEAGRVTRHDRLTLGVFFAGFALMSTLMSWGFARTRAR